MALLKVAWSATHVFILLDNLTLWIFIVFEFSICFLFNAIYLWFSFHPAVLQIIWWASICYFVSGNRILLLLSFNIFCLIFKIVILFWFICVCCLCLINLVSFYFILCNFLIITYLNGILLTLWVLLLHFLIVIACLIFYWLPWLEFLCYSWSGQLVMLS